MFEQVNSVFMDCHLLFYVVGNISDNATYENVAMTEYEGGT